MACWLCACAKLATTSDNVNSTILLVIDVPPVLVVSWPSHRNRAATSGRSIGNGLTAEHCGFPKQPAPGPKRRFRAAKTRSKRRDALGDPEHRGRSNCVG